MVIILGVDAPVGQGTKTQKDPDIPRFRNAAGRDASACQMICIPDMRISQMRTTKMNMNVLNF